MKIYEWFLSLDQRTFATIVIVLCMLTALVFPSAAGGFGFGR